MGTSPSKQNDSYKKVDEYKDKGSGEYKGKGSGEYKGKGSGEYKDKGSGNRSYQGNRGQYNIKEVINTFFKSKNVSMDGEYKQLLKEWNNGNREVVINNFNQKIEKLGGINKIAANVLVSNTKGSRNSLMIQVENGYNNDYGARRPRLEAHVKNRNRNLNDSALYENKIIYEHFTNDYNFFYVVIGILLSMIYIRYK